MLETPLAPSAAPITEQATQPEPPLLPTDPFGNPEAMKRLRRTAKAYFGRSNWHGFRVIFYDWAVIFGIAIGMEVVRANTPLLVYLPLYIVAALAIGSRFRGFENLVHEASHYNMFKTRSWNDSMDFLFALPVFRTSEDFRRSHNVHHANLGHEEVDPDLKRYAEWGVMELPKNFFWIMIARPFTGWLTYHWFLYEFRSFWRSKVHRRSKIIFWAVAGSLLVFAALNGLALQLLLYWVIPFFVVLPIPRFWSVISEHGGLDLRHDVASSRNTLGSAIQQWFIFPHNDGYHETHHLYPSIPWYLIDKADEELMKDDYYGTYVSLSQNLYVTAEHMAANAIITFDNDKG